MTRLQNSLFAFLLCFALFFTACQSAPASSGGTDDPQSTPAEPSTTETATLTARLVDISGDLLLLAGKDDGVYRCAKPEDAPDDLTPGMTVDVTYGGYIKAIYPSEPDNVQKITVRENETDGRCALYLSVLQKLFDTDETLQSDTEYVSVDLTETPLTKGEIQAIAWRFGELTERRPLTFTYKELQDEGYLETDELLWENGCLFKITEKSDENGTLTFDAEKWRAGDGAAYFLDCTAKQKEDGTYTDFEVGAFAAA